MPTDTTLAHPKTDEELLNKVNEFRRIGAGASSTNTTVCERPRISS